MATSREIPLDGLDDAAIKIDDVSSRSSTTNGSPTGQSISDAVRASTVRPQPSPDSTRSPTQLLILDYVEADAPTWQLVQASRRGVTQAAGPVCEPTGLMPCWLTEVPDDLSALKYSTMVDVYNTYEVLTDSGFDETQPPDVDIAVYDEQFNNVAGFTEDSELVPRCAAHALMGARKLKPKRQQLSAQELDALIAEFVSKDVMNYSSHDDLLAAI